MTAWAFPFPLGFVALYEREDDGRKYTLPVVGAAARAEGDPRFGMVMVPAPSASPDVGYVVAATDAMLWEDGWTFKGIGYAEADTQEQGDEDAAAADVTTPGP